MFGKTSWKAGMGRRQKVNVWEVKLESWSGEKAESECLGRQVGKLEWEDNLESLSGKMIWKA